MLFQWEVVVIEELAGNVVISTAKFVAGQPPQKSVLTSISLWSTQGQFFGNTLEATFSLDESVLTDCKEWSFFATPTRVGSPYTSQLNTRVVCNVAETCSRSNCGKFSGFVHFVLVP